jgi:hypothetical protein
MGHKIRTLPHDLAWAALAILRNHKGAVANRIDDNRMAVKFIDVEEATERKVLNLISTPNGVSFEDDDRPLDRKYNFTGMTRNCYVKSAWSEELDRYKYDLTLFIPIDFDWSGLSSRSRIKVCKCCGRPLDRKTVAKGERL